MPLATVTVRQLKNNLSGLDLSIPTVKEIPGLLVDTVEYHILVVSNLSCFKLPQHKETDVVQFVIPKCYEDFENLRKGLVTQNPGTIMPPLTTSILPSFLDSNSAERTSELEVFLKYIALTPNLAASHVTLEFLGVNPLTAGKYTSSSKGGSGLIDRSTRTTPTHQPRNVQLFQEVAEESADLFGSDARKETSFEDEFFSKKTVAPVQKDISNIFKEPFTDFDVEAVSTDDMKKYGFSDADDGLEGKLQKDREDISNLLEVEEDVKELLKLEDAVRTRHTAKEGLPSSEQMSAHLVPSAKSGKPLPAPKPALGKKPPLPKKPSVDKSKEKEPVEEAQLGVDDILNYIKQNPVKDESELDLFS